MSAATLTYISAKPQILQWLRVFVLILYIVMEICALSNSIFKNGTKKLKTFIFPGLLA